ncbi:nucleotidyl transferase AbiEii/AbiGii toxin family protein [Mucilaginibacter sp. SJ]|uniref:nucleotidyl transferase AbiEii/AbiGii toxin family protein n=1 Tax=Mucilaginibacter sp. SJ TaxID=3029053 RepID=UPI0023A961A3|nr:nucleotidyl transferase AbiEii/AbiGii toxin family protein [Mucilaginibacter sp. SJ]WDZ99830.1 nucleotidyl transferase AbiEii/AbiGii toxin family protein [Mucilaginibacter sp. SJ]
MKAVDDNLFKTICELQQLPSLKASVLGGGTSLAIRFSHRVSNDIDFFFPGIIGKIGYELIRKEVEAFYGEAVFAIDYPCDINDQFLLQRFFIRRDDTAIKVEILQNMQVYNTPEIINNVKVMSLIDIGPLKLMTASSRANDKDIYDLDYITDHVSLNELMNLLKRRRELYNSSEHKTIFDHDGDFDPINDPGLLLKFEQPSKGSNSRPGHSNPRIDFIEGQKNWPSARSSWRRKVRAYYNSIGKEFPGIQSL